MTQDHIGSRTEGRRRRRKRDIVGDHLKGSSHNYCKSDVAVPIHVRNRSSSAPDSLAELAEVTRTIIQIDLREDTSRRPPLGDEIGGVVSIQIYGLDELDPSSAGLG